MTRRSSRPSSRGPSPSISTSPSRRATRRTPRRTSGRRSKPFYLSQTEVDPENGTLSMFDFTFDKSYGDPQEVRILAKRSLGAVTLKYRINGGAVQSARPRSGPAASDTAPGNGTYYHVVSGTISGHQPDEQRQGLVRGWRPDERLVHLHGRLREREPGADHGRRGLHGRLAGPDAGPHYLTYYQRGAHGQRGRLRRLRRRCQRPDRPRFARRPEPLRRRDLVHRRRHRHPRAGWGPGTRPVWPLPSCSRSATT